LVSGPVRIEDSVVRRYVLGDLTEDESQRLEEEYFVSDERFSQLLAVEEDLIEDFLRNRLGPGERERFEARFLTTERGRAKVAAQKLAQTAKAPSAKRVLPIAAAVITLAIGVAAFREFVEMRRQIDDLRRERAALRSEVTSLTELLRQQPSRTVESVFSIALRSGERSIGPSATIVLPEGAAAADLWLLLSRDHYPAYVAVLQSVDGETVWTSPSLASRNTNGGKALVVRVPNASLEPLTYVVAVSGRKADGTLEPVEDFSFRVRRP
jgi:hypothetical protein